MTITEDQWKELEKLSVLAKYHHHQWEDLCLKMSRMKQAWSKDEQSK